MLKTLMIPVLFFSIAYCSNPKAPEKNITTILPQKVEQKETTSPIAPTKKSMTEASFQTELLRLVNNLRAKGCRCGRKRMKPVGPLRLNKLLEKAAQAHANDMYRNDFFEHEGSDGSTVGERVERAGYAWSHVGENILWGMTDVKNVFEGWKKSPSHCKAMMDPEYKEMGVAYSGTYWVQDFGTKRNW